MQLTREKLEEADLFFITLLIEVKLYFVDLLQKRQRCFTADGVKMCTYTGDQGTIPPGHHCHGCLEEARALLVSTAVELPVSTVCTKLSSLPQDFFF